MDRAGYERYVACFNARDYDGLMAFFSDDVALHAAGHAMRGKEGIRRFYAFFHEHVRETVRLRSFMPGEGMDFADVVIRFEGLRTLSAERLAAEGYGHMTPVPEGAMVEIEFFICYHHRGGKIHLIRCGIFQPAQERRGP